MRRSIAPVISPRPSIGCPQRVDDTSQHCVADRNRQDAAGGPDSLTFLDVLDTAKHDGADGVLVEVQRQAHVAACELEDLVH